jgi:hypothetical protein
LKADALGSADAANALAYAYKWAIEKQNEKASELGGGASIYYHATYDPILEGLKQRGALEGDYRRAAEIHFLRAANRGYDTALKDLADGYSAGSFGRTDLTEARAWAALWAFGDSEAVTERRQERDSLLNGTSPSEMEAVCRRIREITAESNAVPPVKPALAGQQKTDPLVVRCTSRPESYGVKRSCLDESALSAPQDLEGR